jgi:acetyl-CoA/propionyl-CoA carboxylase biotin carboxyl carrier protein
VDAGVVRGDEVTGRFDPMLAKVIAHGATRDEALDRLTGALDDTLVLGLTTNLRFLRWLVREPVVRDGEVRIDTLERFWPPDNWAKRTALPDEAWAAAAVSLARSAAGTGAADPWRGGWRLNAAPTIRLEAEGQQRTALPDETSGCLHPACRRRRHGPCRRRRSERAVPDRGTPGRDAGGTCRRRRMPAGPWISSPRCPALSSPWRLPSARPWQPVRRS